MSKQKSETGPSPLKALVPVLASGVVFLLVGLAAGTFLGGSAVGGSPAEAAGDSVGQEAAGPEEATGAVEALYRIDDIVVNPSETGGARFLIVSVAIEYGGGEQHAATMERLDPVLRDRMADILAAHTVVELADVSRRDTLRLELRDQIRDAAPGVPIRRVFLPQFVIQ